MRVATTNVQLYNQLRDEGRSAEDLALVARAYDLTRWLCSGRYQANGVPFVHHGVGVASVLAALGQPATFVAAGIVHNIYSTGDFGDGRRHEANERRRQVVREAVGAEVEEIVHRFRGFRLTEGPIEQLEDIEARVDGLDESERRLVLVDLADLLQKYVDEGVAYFGDGSWITDRVAERGDRLVALARRLGEPGLASALDEAIARVAALPPVPDALRQGAQRYSELTVPPSCRRRIAPVAAQRARRLVWRSPGVLQALRVARRHAPGRRSSPRQRRS